MAKKTKTGGRKRGTPNKVTASVKAALSEAFDDLGGVDSLVAWGRENPGDFYKLWARMLPRELKAEMSVGHENKVRIYLPDNGREKIDASLVDSLPDH